MIYGVGIDLLEIGRIERKLSDETFLSRVYTPAERDYISGRGRMAASSAASIFCAKEALGKALGVGLRIPLLEMEVSHGDLGAPQITLRGASARQYEGFVFHLSLTHTAETAGAVVTAEVLQ